MVFCFWVFWCWVFFDEFVCNFDKVLEFVFIVGGIVEVFEDVLEGGFEDGNVILLWVWCNWVNWFV